MDTSTNQSGLKPILGPEWDGLYTFSIDETAAILRISRTQAYRMTWSGEIPTIAIGSHKRVARRTLERMLAG